MFAKSIFTPQMMTSCFLLCLSFRSIKGVRNMVLCGAKILYGEKGSAWVPTLYIPVIHKLVHG